MGQFDHENAKAFRDTLTRLLKGIFNPTSTGKGISELIETALNAGNSVRATRVVTPEDVLSESKDEAESNTPPTIPTITLRPNAIEEANSRNVTYQSIIGAKEGATEIIKRVVGSDIVDAVLRTADGADYKAVNDYQLHQLTDAMMDGANRPDVAEVHEQLLDALTFAFNFRQKCS